MIWQHFIQIWRDIFSDKGAILLLFAASIIYSFFYPLPYRLEQVQAVPIAIADKDHSHSSRALIQLLQASPTLTLQQLSADTDAIQQALWQGDIMALLIIPEGFQADLLAGKAQLQLASHDGYLLASGKALAAVSQTALTMGAQLSLQRLQSAGLSATQAAATVQPVILHNRPLYNTHEGYGSYIVPGVMVLIIQQTLLMGVTLLLGLRAEQNRLEKGYAAYSGTLLAFTSVGFINCLYFFVAALRIQGYSQLSTPLPLLLFSLLFSVCIAAFAITLASAFANRERGLQLLLATAIPMLFLSGYSWPVEAMPPLLQQLRWLLPSTAGIQGFVALNQMGASLNDISTEIINLLILAVLGILAGLWLYRPVAAKY